MKNDDYEKFRTLLANVHAFYQRDISSFALNVWWQAMQPFDFEAVNSAFTKHCVNPDSGQFAPKPADIVKMLRGSTLDSAYNAWAKVDRAVRSIGTYADVVFDDPLIHRVIHDMGGWTMFGKKNESDWPFVAKEFENRYRGFKAHGDIPAYPSILIGISNAENANKGYPNSDPILIGDEQLAKKVMANGSQDQLLKIERVGAFINSEEQRKIA